MLKRLWKPAALAVLAVCVLAAEAYRLRPATGGDAPELRLPAEVRGRPGRLVIVTAQTPAAKVRWHACAGPDRPDLWQPVDGKTLLFSTPTPGRYEVWAWTAAGGEPTEAVGCTVLVETPEPPEPPPPSDPLFTDLQRLYAADTAPGKAAARAALAGVYRYGADLVAGRKSARVNTLGELFEGLRKASEFAMPADAPLVAVRQRLADEHARVFPGAPGTPLDDDARKRAEGYFLRLARLIDTLK